MTRPIARALALLALLPACTTLPNGPARTFAPAVRGVTLADWTAGGYDTPAARATLDAIGATGANDVTLIVTAYQPNASASAIDAADPRTPTAAAIGAAIAAAHARGLAVTLKPHLDLVDGAWRGHAEPANVAAWFVSYRAFIVPWARLADSLGAARFVVGTELAGTTSHAAEWRATIAAVRARFSGQLVYAASWDEAHRIGFWDALDVVGVDFYFPVAARTDPGRLELLAGWAPWLDRLERLHVRAGKRVLITEIGYRSVDGAGLHPFAFAPGGRFDPGEQADLYWAALEATGAEGWIEGLIWWNWLADGTGGQGNLDYTPFAKPAAAELTAAWTP